MSLYPRYSIFPRWTYRKIPFFDKDNKLVKIILNPSIPFLYYILLAQLYTRILYITFILFKSQSLNPLISHPSDFLFSSNCIYRFGLLLPRMATRLRASTWTAVQGRNYVYWRTSRGKKFSLVFIFHKKCLVLRNHLSIMPRTNDDFWRKNTIL